jgi:EAL domain-containing protein (putative c-di-GMP-specific phosphodiesterase class I)/PleD family two-component response regulator
MMVVATDATDATVVLALGADLSAERLVTVVAQAGARPVSVVADIDELDTLLAETATNAMLVDMALAAPDPGRLSALIGTHPGVPVVALCSSEGPAVLAAALAAGVTAFVAHDAAPAEMAAAIAAALVGRRVVSPGLLDRLLTGAAEALRRGDDGSSGGTQRAAAVRSTILAPGALYPVFQPIADLRGSHQLGWLALTRFTDHAAEETGRCFADAAAAGLACELEVAAAAAALEQIDRLPDSSLLFIKASCTTIARLGLEPVLDDSLAARVVIELSGVAELGDATDFDDAVSRLRHRGIRFAVDETGAGFGPLDHVLDLSPAFVRLAGGLTRGIDADRTRRALALTVISFASHLGAKVIADQIETADELDALRRLGVGYGLGFHIGRPRALPERARGASSSVVPSSLGLGVDDPSQAPILPVVWARGGGSLPVPARALSTFDSASAAVLRLVAQRLGDASPYVGLLDRHAGLLRIVDALEAAPAGLEVGAVHALAGSTDDLATAGRLPQTGAPDAAALPTLGHWAVVPFAGSPEQPLATLSVIATEPLGDDALQLLRDAAGVLAAVLEKEYGSDHDTVGAALREHAGRDRFTGLLNANRFREVLAEANERALARGGLTYVVAVTVNNLEALAERHGQAVGGLVMKDIARSLALEAEHVDALARVGPTTFGCVVFGRRASEVEYFCNSVADRVTASGRRRGATVELRTGLERLGLHGSPEDAWQAAIDRLFSA